MTNITVAVPDELAEVARTKGVLDPQRLTTLMCEVLVRETSGDDATETEWYPQEPDDGLSLSEALMKFAGAAGPGLPEDFAANHDHYIHGLPKR